MNIDKNTLFNVVEAKLSAANGDLGDFGYLFVFKISGEMKVLFGGSERLIKGGKTAIFRLSDGYSFKDSGATSYFIVDGELCKMLMQSYDIPCGAALSVQNCAEGFFEMVRAYSKHSDGDMQYIFHGILLKIYKEMSKITSDSADIPQLICDYIDANVSEKLTLDKISELFFLSKSQIFRIFKTRFGKSPMQYHMEKKLEAVKKMLEDTDMRISDIAEEMSFSDAKHLTKSFKAAFDILPKDYRRAFKVKNAYDDGAVLRRI